MLLLGIVAGLMAVAASTVASAHPEATPSASRCGGSLWRLMTLSDPLRGRVNMRPATSSVAALAARSGPGRPPSSRDAFERQVWEVTAQIVKYRSDSAGVHFQLFKDDAYMQAFLPHPTCLPSTARGRKTMVATRAWFLKNCGQASSSWKPLGALVRINGVGFWSGDRSSSGSAPNGARLAPVIGIHPLAGCGAAGG